MSSMPASARHLHMSSNMDGAEIVFCRDLDDEQPTPARRPDRAVCALWCRLGGAGGTVCLRRGGYAGGPSTCASCSLRSVPLTQEPSTKTSSTRAACWRTTWARSTAGGTASPCIATTATTTDNYDYDYDYDDAAQHSSQPSAAAQRARAWLATHTTQPSWTRWLQPAPGEPRLEVLGL
jgi:hypothetical protein